MPIGVSRVELNAHRVFDPQDIIDLAKANGLQLNVFPFTVENGLMSLIAVVVTKPKGEITFRIFTLTKHI